MDISTNDARARYIAGTAQPSFQYDFPIYDQSQLVVIRQHAGVTVTLAFGADYTVNGVGNDAGGNIYPVAATVAGDIWVLERDTPVSRDEQTDFMQGGDIDADALNKAIDLLYMIQQERDRDQGRTIELSVTAPDDVNTTLQDPVADQYLAWDSTGKQIISKTLTSTGVIGLPVSLANGGLGTSNASYAAVRTLLGLGTAALLNVGTGANQVVQLDGTGKLPAVDGSQLTNVAARVPAGRRQTVNGGAVDATTGAALCLSVGSGLAPVLLATAVAVLITAAGGFLSTGGADRNAYVAADTSFPAVIGSQTINSSTNSTTTATVTTAAAHGLITGAEIKRSGATPAAYNGTFIVTVTGATTFTYVMASNPGGSTTVQGNYTVTNFLKAAISAGGVATLGSTLLPPIYQQGGVPSTTAGQYTFNRGEMKMYAGNGGAAPQVWETFIGECDAASAVISAVTSYAYNGRAVTAWTNTLPASAVTTAIAHNLGMIEVSGDTKFQIKNITAQQQFTPGMIVENFWTATGGASVPLPVYFTGRNQATIQAGNANPPWASLTTGGVPFNITLASWAYRLVIDRGW